MPPVSWAMRSILIPLLAGLCCLLCLPAASAASSRDKVMVPPALDAEGGVILPPDHPVERSSSDWLKGLSLAVSLNYPLAQQRTGSGGRARQGDRSAGGSNTASLSVQYVPISYWFASVTAFVYQQPARQQPWNPDFTYCFGYNDWHPNTASLTYCNYGGNRYSGLRSDFQTGGWTAAWKFNLPRWLADPMLIDRSGSIGCNVGYAFSLAFENGRTARREGYKDKLLLGCGYPVWKGLALNWTAYHYLRDGQQQPWDPDYTYGFGYAGDSRYGNWALQYGNYSGNRFPGRDRSPGTGTFLNGTVSLSWRKSY